MAGDEECLILPQITHPCTPISFLAPCSYCTHRRPRSISDGVTIVEDIEGEILPGGGLSMRNSSSSGSSLADEVISGSMMMSDGDGAGTGMGIGALLEITNLMVREGIPLYFVECRSAFSVAVEMRIADIVGGL